MNSSDSPPQIGSVSKTNKPIEVIQSDGSVRIIKTGDPIYLDDIIKNGTTSNIIITLANGQTITIAPQQELLIGIDLFQATASGNTENEKTTFSENTNNQSTDSTAEIIKDKNEENIESDRRRFISQPVIEREQRQVESLISEGNSNSPSSAFQAKTAPIETDSTTFIPAINNNSRPSANIININATEDGTAVTGNFSATDADTTDVLSYTIQTTPAEGAVTNNHDGTFSFDPGSDFQDLAAGETRDVTFTYVAVDDSGTGNATSDPKTVTITVTGTNDQPIAEVVSISATEDGTAVTGNFSATDADTTDVLSYTIQTTPAEGAVTNNHDGTFSFDPGSDFQDLAAGETRNVTFTYVAVDDSGTGNATSDPKTVTITVTGTNDQPIAEVVSISATEDGTAVTGNFSATDADTTDVLSYTIQTTPAEGAVTNNHDGTFSFDPGSDFQDLAAGETATSPLPMWRWMTPVLAMPPVIPRPSPLPSPVPTISPSLKWSASVLPKTERQ